MVRAQVTVCNTRVATSRRGAGVYVPAAVVLNPLPSLGAMREVADAVVVCSLAERAEDSNTVIILGDGNSSKQRFLQLSRLIASLA